MPADIFIVTAEMDPSSQAWLGELRHRYYPPENLSAHLTLFYRAILGNVQTIAFLSLPNRTLLSTFSKLRRLVHGVAVDVVAPELKH